VSKVDMI